MLMVRLFTLLTLSFSCFIFFSCKKSASTVDQLPGNWVSRSDFDGVARSEGISFVIGDTAYIGTGYDGTNRLNDFWKYNISANHTDNGFWLQVASLPSDPRNSAVGFSTSTKGYIATGYNGLIKLKNTWEYDPTQNTWAQKKDFGGSARIGAVGFGINDKGYVSTGNDGNDVKDCWMYDPAADTWVEKTSIPGLPREGAVAFAYKDQAYIVTGHKQ